MEKNNLNYDEILKMLNDYEGIFGGNIKNKPIEKDPNIKITDDLILKPFEMDEDYMKKWNIHPEHPKLMKLYYKDKLVSDNFYRHGGLFSIDNSGDDRYFMIFKMVEDMYSDAITTVLKDKYHLSEHYCIIDNKGNEKQVIDTLNSPYLVGGLVFSIGTKYYNIETGELYCNSYKSMKTENYLFLHNEYDSDIEKRGVLKIKKSDGSFELIK